MSCHIILGFVFVRLSKQSAYREYHLKKGVTANNLIYLLVISFKYLPLRSRICSLIRIVSEIMFDLASTIGCMPTHFWHPSTQYCSKIDWTDNLSNFCHINILIVAQNIGQQIKSLIRALGRKYSFDDLNLRLMAICLARWITPPNKPLFFQRFTWTFLRVTVNEN